VPKGRVDVLSAVPNSELAERMLGIAMQCGPMPGRPATALAFNGRRRIIIDDEDVRDCVRGMVNRHGLNAMSVAKIFAEAHRAAGEDESATFWDLVADAVGCLRATSLN
jgi:hypothetical protein